MQYINIHLTNKNGKCYSPKDEPNLFIGGLQIDEDGYEDVVDEEGYIGDYIGTGSWNKEEKIYYGIIYCPELDFVYTKDEFLEYLDEYADSFDWGDIEDNMSEDEIKDYIEDIIIDLQEDDYLEELPSSSAFFAYGSGSDRDFYEDSYFLCKKCYTQFRDKPFIAYGSKDNEYNIGDYLIHEQRTFDLTLSVNIKPQTYLLLLKLL